MRSTKQQPKFRILGQTNGEPIDYKSPQLYTLYFFSDSLLVLFLQSSYFSPSHSQTTPLVIKSTMHCEAT
jgi:hypothetical protein